MKKIIYSALFCLVASGLKLNAQSITVKLVHDDPYDIKNFSLAIDPLFFDVNGQNGYSAGWGLRGDYMLGKRFQFNADLRSAFGTSGYDIKDNNTRNYFYFEPCASLILSHKESVRNVPIILSSSSHSSGGYTYTRTVSLAGGYAATFRKMVMLRGGLYMMNNSLNLTKLNDSLTVFEDKKNNVKYTRKQAQDSLGVKEFGGIGTTTFFAGFNFRSIARLLIDVEGYGYRGRAQYSDFYIDGMFAPVIAAKNYDAKDKAGNDVKLDVQNSSKLRFGWRMGWYNRKPKDQGFSYKFEFGQRPDFRHGNGKEKGSYFKQMYCMFTFGLYVPLKLKPFYGGE